MNLPNSSRRIELFYSPLCSLCPQAKEVARAVAEEQQVRLEEINIFAPEGEARANKYGIKGVPTLVVNGERRITGVPDKEQLIRLLNDN